jgi:radical SAM-linked protein
MKAHRIRITFARGPDLKYITHLDMMRFWERALRRANVPLAYSEGFSPHPQISLAAPLAVGTTSDAELMDVYLSAPMAPGDLIKAVMAKVPAGVSIVAAREVGMALPALQADVRFADYTVEVDLTTPYEQPEVSEPPPAARSHDEAQLAVDRFLAAAAIPWEHKRQDEVRSYDIRAQVADLKLAAAEGDRVTITMRLKNDNTGSGRPEQVAAALGLPPPARIHRTKLILESDAASPAWKAWRTRGRFEE